MSEHPIEGLMLTAMNSIREMIDVNTIIGEPIETLNNIMIIPISKVGFGFASGGSEFSSEAINEYNRKDKEEEVSYKLPFGGGSGAGVSITPVAFLVVQDDNVKLISVNHSSAIDKLLDYVPDLMEKMNTMLNKKMDDKKEEKREEIQRKIEKEIKEEQKKEDELNRKNENMGVNQNVAKVHPKRKIEYQPEEEPEAFQIQEDEEV